ncbi:UDP-N-acetylmuramoylalanine--D-glutamate ligase [Litorimonas taeanensis]|uniref:UDP-N-acetylmuramoylalanine--D-glutamate ligase n=1 Tax=Litorimonas taeanensis TaxID=568099 RepID=A0A420WLG0_9PROT|nr:UDP-N-acetylmuramoyl-L-alanine--D-glutamate ligase [Litorimonas taeanensis]RKQ71715.1 UDP-N-acetylmuramoylalanine--D-glutamate ligase [Litorimonas taeanensis]
MIKAAQFAGQTLAVFGLGRSGITAALSLQAGGATVLAWDDREEARQSAESQGVDIADISQSDWSQIDALVLSPGVPHILPEPHWSAALATQADVPIICDIEIFAREVAAVPEENRPKIIAITGTNGKSTTTALIGHILNSCGKDAQIGGNIGRGVLDLDRMHSGSYFVVELSSYQLERTYSLRANAAVYLNLSPDHLDRHGDMEGYAQAKNRVFLNQLKEDAAIIGTDDENGQDLLCEMKAEKKAVTIPISAKRSIGSGVFVLGGKLFSTLGKRVEEVCNLSKAKALEGQHNWQNAAAAFAAVQSLGLNPRDIGKAILSFPGLSHRMETIGKAGKVRFVNDSKATNADAAKQALNSYDEIYWIAGGVAKEGGIEPLKPLFKNIQKAYLIGEAAKPFARTLSKSDTPYKLSGELRMAVLCATRDALESGAHNPIVLLSPACASFDQFANFEIRGDAFRDCAQKVIDLFDSEMKAKRRAAKNAIAS